MQIVISLLIFIFLLGLLILLHELGHFLAAKRAGVIVQEFAFGFGPRLLGRTWRGTQYRVNLIPLGGYVKMLGDQDASSFARFSAKDFDSADREFALKLLKENKLDPKTSPYFEIESFIKTQEQKLSEAEFVRLYNYFSYDYIPNHPGNYDNKRIRDRILIIVAGVFMNFVLGAVIFYVLFLFTGFTVDLVKLGNPIFVGAQTSSPPVIHKLYGSEEELENSVVIEVNGQIVNEEQFLRLVRENYNQPLELKLFTQSGYQTVELTLDGDGVKSNFDQDVINKVILISVNDDGAARSAGLEPGDVILSFAGEDVRDTSHLLELLQSHKGRNVITEIINGNGEYQSLNIDLPSPDEGPILGAVLGVNDGFYRGALRVNYNDNKLLSGFLHATNMTFYSISGIGELVSQSIRERSIAPVSQGFSSIIGVADVIYSLVGLNDFLNIVNLAGLISVTLAFMNILPIPLFDGGNLLFLLIEKFRGRPLSMEKQEKIGKYSFFILMILIVLIMVKDVIQFNWLERLFNLIRSIFGG